MSEKQQAHISHVHLKGYKSIHDLEVDLLPGLNIIIGPNGSGKTNFLEFVLFGLLKKFSDLNGNFSFDFFFNNMNISEWRVKSIFNRNQREKSYIEESDNCEGIESTNKLPYSDNLTQPFGKSLDSYNEIINQLSPFIKIDFRLPENIPILDVPYSTDNNTIFNFPKFASFANFIDSRLGFMSSNLYHYSNKNNNDFVSGFFDLELNVLRNLNQFSPIKDVRLSKGFNFNTDNLSQFYLSYLSFEFLINNSWVTWKQLSDGTKRLFYLIHEVAYFNKGTILVEEPELGIHPDQLYKLMTFLKEQSKEKQIILTTHSPEVLNILGKDELDRIIVTRYDDKKGTQMHHLSENQIRKGHIYMDEVGDISDFWVHSNLEEYEA